MSLLDSKCDNCNKAIHVKPYKKKKYPHHFCSRPCQYDFISKLARSRRSLCLNCGRTCNSKYAKFCSQSCHFKHNWTKGVWQGRIKEPLSTWRKLQIRNSAFIIICPNMLADEFSVELNALINTFNSNEASRSLGIIKVRHSPTADQGQKIQA